MELPLSESVVDRLVYLPEAGSTNDELVARAAGESDFSVLVTDNQTAGRGRLGRVWVAPPGKTLAISVLLRPTRATGVPLELEHFGWLPLIAGVAMARAVASVVPEERVGLKWPNDVQVGGLKVSGLLAELGPSTSSGTAVVMGAGVNLTMTKDELPTDASTSLLLEGATGGGLADTVLSTYLTVLKTLYSSFLGGDTAEIRAIVIDACTTLGKAVRVELPGGDTLYGVATGIDSSGRLEVTDDANGAITAVAAGDVTHLRYE